ncbi:hypothetical protein F2Q69_00002605 [Brassica cretica]|uniref:Uncharacterized protein n=1 Tax=Brassica cretica TaxID=69181 RepID=A0A8S9PN99_BRACR|nr:hypothetical protein F2Q69_00002605 [Brassica cretica]
MDDIYSAVAAFPHPSSSIPSSPTSGQMGQEQRHQSLDCNQGRDLIWTIKAISSQARHLWKARHLVKAWISRKLKSSISAQALDKPALSSALR